MGCCNCAATITRNAAADAMEALERKLMAGVTTLDVHGAVRSDHGV